MFRLYHGARYGLGIKRSSPCILGQGMGRTREVLLVYLGKVWGRTREVPLVSWGKVWGRTRESPIFGQGMG